MKLVRERGVTVAQAPRDFGITSEPFQRLLEDRSGNCWDNAAMEKFFSSLKRARFLYYTRDQAKADVSDLQFPTAALYIGRSQSDGVRLAG